MMKTKIFLTASPFFAWMDVTCMMSPLLEAMTRDL
jgi:hypothetical protein